MTATMTTLNEKTYNDAITTFAKLVVKMVQEDHDNVEDQRGEVGNYLGSAIEDVQQQIEQLL